MTKPSSSHTPEENTHVSKCKPRAHILLLAPAEMAKLLSRSGLDSPFESQHFTPPYLPFLHPLHSLTHHSLSTKAPPVLSSSLLEMLERPPPPTTPSRAANTRSLCRSGPGFMELTHTHEHTHPIHHLKINDSHTYRDLRLAAAKRLDTPGCGWVPAGSSQQTISYIFTMASNTPCNYQNL